MTYALQKIYIFVLNPIYALTGKISEKARSVIIQILCFCFPLFFVLRHSSVLYSLFSLNETQYQLLGTLLIILLIVFSINAPLHTIKWRKLLLYPIIITGICIIVISFIHTVGLGYRVFGFMMLFLYPCLFFVWNNRSDYERLFVPLSIAICVIGCLLFLYSYYQSTIGEFIIFPGNRSAGWLRNPNLFSMIGMVTFCSALYLLVAYRKTISAFLFTSISLGTGFAIVILGQSRLSIAICITCVLATIYFYIRHSEKSALTIIIIKIIVAFNIVLFSLLVSQSMIIMQQASIQPDVSSAPQTTVPVVEPPNSTLSGRFDLDNSVDMNTFSSGRIIIWNSYVQHLNLLGNDFDSTNWLTIAHDPSYHAHNNFIEMSYRFGVPVGILFIILEIIAGIIALGFLFINRQKDISCLFSVIFMIMFTYESMLDVATLPFERITPCYFFFALIPMVDATINKKQ